MALSSEASVPDLLKNFSVETTAHGFHSIRHARSKLGKTCWIVCIAFMWGVCIYQTAQTIDRYFCYFTKTQVQIKNMQHGSYPAVSVCNLNALRASQYNKFPLVFKDIKAALHGIDNDMAGVAWPEIENFTSKYPNVLTASVQARSAMHFAIYENKVRMQEMGHQIEDMLLECTFQGKYCTPLNFSQWIFPSYGNCYTIFLHQANAYIGPDYGLALSLYVEEDEYLPKISQAAGFRVQIHPPTYLPLMDDQGFTISTGAFTSVAFSEIRMRRQDYPYDFSNCGDAEEVAQKDNIFSYWDEFVKQGLITHVNYTSDSCAVSCFLHRLYHQCGCLEASEISWQQAGYHFGMDNIPPPCNKSDFVQMRCLSDTAAQSTVPCAVDCPQPCYEVNYNLRVTSCFWPRPTFFESNKDTWAERVPAVGKLNASQTGYNLAKMEVYFQSLTYQSIDESAAMDIWQLLSNFGGTLGLYVGVGFLTVLEFAELGMRITKARLRAKQVTPALEQNGIALSVLN